MTNSRATRVGIRTAEDDGTETSLRESVAADHPAEGERVRCRVDGAVAGTERSITRQRQGVRPEEVGVRGEREGIGQREARGGSVEGAASEGQCTRAEGGTITDRETTIDEGHATIEGISVGGDEGARARLG